MPAAKSLPSIPLGCIAVPSSSLATIRLSAQSADAYKLSRLNTTPLHLPPTSSKDGNGDSKRESAPLYSHGIRS